jgi:putative CocE/NonD family hydrolase
MMFAFFDKFLKGSPSPVMDTLAKVRYYVMGANRWESSDVWPPRGATTMSFHLGSGGNANTRNGDGRLTTTAPSRNVSDGFTYDPANPVMSNGGNVCCQGNAVQPGARDQQTVELRPDVLVYTTEPFTEGIELTGPIVPTLYVSSDAKDTDFTIKILDVYPDGRAYNLDESIQRMRWREGYDKPPVWMEKDKVYKVTFQPLTTSNWFAPGHRLRIEISSSNFPRFDRNLNTGGNNWDENAGVIARNRVFHGPRHPSSITVTVMPRVQP